MIESPTVAWLAERLSNCSTKEIAIVTTALIRSGAIPVGAQLPPVRELAQALSVSPATISAAWGQLRKYKVITGQGRNGVWVSGDKITARPIRFETIGNFGNRIVADLTSAAPDPDLLPDLRDAMANGLATPDLNSYQHGPITGLLREAVAKTWPYQPEAFLATNGGYDGMHLTLQTLVMPGSTVAIEDPTAMRLLDILDHLGAHVLSVTCDNHGPELSSLTEAMKHKPAAFIYQPRTNAVTGRIVSSNRLRKIADLLKASDTVIVEDDGIGDISCQEPLSLGAYCPERTVHIRSFSKSLGPDLRLAVLSSSAEIVDQLRAYRSFGSRWTSRILQNATAWLLNDDLTHAVIAKARETYKERRNTLIGKLQKHAIDASGGDGLCLWLPVPSEQYALVTLAARGIAVLPGARFRINDGQYIRVATSLLTEHVDAVAEALALGCTPPKEK